MSQRRVQDCYYTSDDGLRLFYRDYQVRAQFRKTPVICLPGLTRNSTDFQGLATQLQLSRRVIAPDQRGRGNSKYDAAWQNYNPDRYVQDMWQLLNVTGIDRVVVVGTSLGGWMANIMAMERPDKIEAVIINDIGPELEAPGITRITNGVGRLPETSSLQEAIESVRSVYGPIYPDWSERRWREFTLSTYAETDRASYDLRYDRQIGVAVRLGTSGLKQDPWELFAALRNIPMLSVRGALSDILSVRTVDQMRKLKPDMYTVTISNRGHAPLLDEPESINAITTFLDTL